MKQFLTAIFVFSIVILGYSQKGTVRGNIYDKSSGQPIAYANVYISGSQLGATSDDAGFFTIANVPNGNHVLVASLIGYNSDSTDISVKNNIYFYKFYLSESSISLNSVEISAKKEKARSDVQISKVSITPKQIKALPSIGGEADIAQYLPVLPGIISTGDQGGQIYIRGGSPVQTRILLDGMTIYNPFHSIGFFSVFETEIVRNVDVLTGAFNAEYGGRISAVVDIKTRDGNKKNLGGILAVNPFLSKILLEGPISKQKDDGSGSSSFIFTAKKAYLDQTSKSLYSYANNGNGLPFNFTDVYGKMSFETGNGSKFNFFGFNHVDNVLYNSIANLQWNQYGGGTNFFIIPPSSNSVIGGYINYSNYGVSLQEGTNEPRTSSIGGFNLGLNFTNYGNKGNENKFGFDVNGFTTDFKFRNYLGYTFSQNNNTTELAAYVKLKRKLGALVIEPSLRIQYYVSLSEPVFEPRIGAKLNAKDWLRFKFAAGLYSQNLISTVSEQDIVNLFVGFLSGPEEKFYKPGKSQEEVTTRLQKSMHAIGGAEIDLATNLEFNVETYYKRFSQLIGVNRNKLLSTDPDYITETGNSYGLDFTLKYDNKKLYLWATYSLGYVRRNDGYQEYATNFDRRHNINLLGTYNFGKKQSWEFSARWNMGSGFPFTLTQGFYDRNNLTGGINTSIPTSNGSLGIIYSDQRNTGRLPYYHRLDLSLKKKIEFSKHTKLDIVLSVTNAYNRQNIFYFDRVTYKRVDQLPVLPSLGFIFSF